MKHLPFLLLILLFSCKKDKHPETPAPKPFDTIKPNPYLPVYPGSWWEFKDNKGGTITHQTGPTYVKDQYTIKGMYSDLPSDTVLVPLYMGRKIWGRWDHVHFFFHPYTEFIPVVSDSIPVGAGWLNWKYDSHSNSFAGVRTRDTSIIIAGKTYSPTIVIQYTQGGDSAPYYLYQREYYTKDIGLVRTETMDTNNRDSVASFMEIVRFHINR